ncbi:hypothetical protein ACNSOP_03175 [Aliarcobacter lanthieri]|uniref:hypothetical protein n=1 Tax=Aliarcobacter lanthieri TaxID=1355374 RepID=UPI001924640E|nr:hypothetical protein [Aliarcobacter lanthieri]MBL3519157.1 hypothetical protein [Aliarcobacter lanthieri]
MYIVANMVFYTCGKLDIKKIKSCKNLDQLKIDSFANYNLQGYWFNRLSENSYKYIEFDFRNIKNLFKKNINTDKEIEKLKIKVHITGITSVEIYFKISNEFKTAFHSYLDEFIKNYSKEIFDLIYDLNIDLNKNNLLNLPENFRFSSLVYNSKNIQNRLNNSYSFRVHYFTQNRENYEKLINFYNSEKINSKSTIIEVDKDIYDATIYKDSVLWFNEKIDLYELSKLLDIDSNTMNESVIYKKSGELYTDLMYQIDFKKKIQISSNTLIEMHKINSYFLQKCNFTKFNSIENIDNFIDIQKNIEKFDTLKEIFEKSEKNYLDICEVVEANEKAQSSRTVQYILVFLTLLTIISVSQGIIDFINIGFSKEHLLEISVISRFELVILLLVIVLFMFIKIQKYIKKS